MLKRKRQLWACMRDKRDLDQTDLRLLQLLSENARRPYSDLADAVDLSAPAVANRIERLQDQGIITQFTIDIDRRKLQQRTPVMIELEVHPIHSDTLYDSLCSLSGVEHVFQQYDGTIVVYGNAPEQNLRKWLEAEIDLDDVTALDFELVERYQWVQDLDETEFALPCLVCDNTVKSDGITATIGGRTLAFCCPSCRGKYEAEFEKRNNNATEN